jgi:hypothetical protein
MAPLPCYSPGQCRVCGTSEASRARDIFPLLVNSSSYYALHQMLTYCSAKCLESSTARITPVSDHESSTLVEEWSGFVTSASHTPTLQMAKAAPPSPQNFTVSTSDYYLVECKATHDGKKQYDLICAHFASRFDIVIVQWETIFARNEGRPKASMTDFSVLGSRSGQDLSSISMIAV